MKIARRSAAKILGLALGVAPWLGGSTAEAQWAYVGTPNWTYPAPYRYPTPTSITPRTWTYSAAPTYGPRYNYYQPARRATGSAYSSHYGYSPARRPLFLHKPWLSRD